MKWYHVSNYNHGEEFEAKPNVPFYLRAGEDRRTPRICVCANYKHCIRSICLVKRAREYYVYEVVGDEEPINPLKHRKELLESKAIRKRSNDFVVLEDGIINKEHWFIKPVKMKRIGVVQLPKKYYVGMILGMGMSGEPPISCFKLKPYKEKNLDEMCEEMFGKRRKVNALRI